MSPIKSPVEAELLSLQLADKTQTAIRFFTSICANKNAPVLILLPAMGVRAVYYTPFAQAIADKGCHIVTTDIKGLGHSSVRASRKVDFGYHHMLMYDMPAIVKVVKERFSNHPIYLMGHSLGGHFAMLYASLHSEQLAGILFCAAGSPHYKNWGKWHAPLYWIGTQGFYLLSRLLGYFPGKSVGFGGREARTLMRDWSTLARTGKFKIAHQQRDFEALIRAIELPVLSISLEGDNLAPINAVKSFNAKLKRANLIHLRLRSKTKKPYNHFNWVKNKEEVINRIVNWLLNQ